jgi:ferrous-iron efflux pump FieF
MDKLRAAFTSLLAGFAVTAFKLLAWTGSLSVAVLADAVHSAVDLLAVTITYLAVRTSLKPPDQEHPYGHHKAEALGGVGGSLAVLVSAIFIAYEAVMKVAHWEPYTPTLVGIVAMAVAILIDLNRVLLLRRFRGVSKALEADALHFATDLASSSAILVALMVGALGLTYAPETFRRWGPALDVALAAAITAYFVKLSLELLKSSVMELLDYAPSDVVERARRKAQSVAGVHSVKSVKVRKSGGIYHAELTITVDENLTVREAHEIADKVEKIIKEELGGDVSVHVEPSNSQKTSNTSPPSTSTSQ